MFLKWNAEDSPAKKGRERRRRIFGAASGIKRKGIKPGAVISIVEPPPAFFKA